MTLEESIVERKAKAKRRRPRGKGKFAYKNQESVWRRRNGFVLLLWQTAKQSILPHSIVIERPDYFLKFFVGFFLLAIPMPQAQEWLFYRCIAERRKGPCRPIHHYHHQRSIDLPVAAEGYRPEPVICQVNNECMQQIE